MAEMLMILRRELAPESVQSRYNLTKDSNAPGAPSDLPYWPDTLLRSSYEPILLHWPPPLPDQTAWTKSVASDMAL